LKLNADTVRVHLVDVSWIAGQEARRRDRARDRSALQRQCDGSVGDVHLRDLPPIHLLQELRKGELWRHRVPAAGVDSGAHERHDGNQDGDGKARAAKQR
jgi:hypothetical protein